MGRPPSDLDDYLEWQQRLENQKARPGIDGAIGVGTVLLVRHPSIVFDYTSGHGRDGPQNFRRAGPLLSG